MELPRDIPGDALRDWLAKTPEDAIDPEQPIVDPHHHLWDRRPRPELEPDARSHLRYLGDDLIEDIRGGGHNVVDTVFIECRAMYRENTDDPFASVGEVEFVQGVAAMADSGLYGEGVRCCGGIVGFANLTRDDAEDVLLALKAAGRNFRGIRHAHGWHASPDIRNSHHPTRDIEGLLGRDDFRAGFKALDKHGFTFDCWGFHTQLNEVADLAAAFPGVTIILNHIGGPMAYGPYEGQRDTEVFETWREGMQAVSAASDNVVVKVGGCGMPTYGYGHETWEAPPSSAELAADWKRYLAHVIELFGPDRCMFESNFPVDKVSCSYTTLWNAFKLIANELGLSRDEKNAMFYGTAARAYSLTLNV